MGEDNKLIYGLLEEIRELLEGNEKGDGSFRFDPLRVKIALEYVKSTLEREVEAYRQMERDKNGQ